MAANAIKDAVRRNHVWAHDEMPTVLRRDEFSISQLRQRSPRIVAE
jgi:hypothetical protein